MEGDDSQDEALRAAIAASLKTPGARGNREEVVDLTADSDDEKPQETVPVENDEVEDSDEEMVKAIQLSLKSHSSSSPVSPTEVKDVASTPKVESKKSGTSEARYGIPGLDRKKQEEERLARIAKKRKATSKSPPPTARIAKVTRPESSSINNTPRPVNPPLSSGNPELLRTPQQEQKGNGLKSTLESKSNLRFPTGAVKKTWAYGYPRMDDIKIEEVLEPSDLKLAVLSSFQWDMEWLFSKLDQSGARTILMMQAKDDSTVRRRQSAFSLVGNPLTNF